MTDKALMYSKTNIGGYFFDAYIRLEHKSTLKITSHPVETGASVSDHSYVEPSELKLEIMMSDVVSTNSSDQFNNSNSRSVSAFQTLLEIQRKRSPVSVYTRLKTYKNMLISSLSVDDTADTVEALNASVTLVEIPMATLSTVKISLDTQTTDSTQMGAVEPSSMSESVRESLNEQMTSILYNAFGRIA